MKRYILSAVRNLSEEDSDTRKAVASDPDTNVETLRELSSDIASTVRARVAANPNTPEDILLQLATDSSHHVREYLAKNEALPPSVFRTLYQSSIKDEYILTTLASREDTPADVLEALADQTIWRSDDILYTVAANPKTPEKTLIDLAMSYPQLAYTVAGNEQASPAVLEAIYGMYVSYNNIIEQLASHPNLPVDIIEDILRRRNSIFVLSEMATRQDLTDDMYRELAGDCHSRPINWPLLQNPKVPSDVIKRIIELNYTIEELQESGSVMRILTERGDIFE